MEHSKNAMYQRVGRERGGWIQSVPEEDGELAGLMMTAPVPITPAAPVVPAMPTMPEFIPEPPVVEMPADEVELCTTPVMAYVPCQKWEDIYEAEAGLKRGTIFAQLDLPFVGEGACNGE